MIHMPQEIEVWYILPSIRKELAKVLVEEHKLSQKDVADLLGVSGAAISQYLKSKRGKEVVFDEEIIKEIKDSANKIAKDKQNLMGEMQRLCNLSSTKLLVCKIHRGKDKRLNNCDVCLS